MTCPDLEELARTIDEAEASADALEHVARCPRCARRRELLLGIRSMLAAPPPPAPREALVRRIVEGIRRPEEQASPLLRLAARLVGPDERALPALRGQGLARRHLRGEVEGYEVDVADMGGGDVVGNLLAPPGLELGEAICALAGESTLAETPLQPNGDFHFAAVEPGRYRLLVRTPEVELAFEGLDVGCHG